MKKLLFVTSVACIFYQVSFSQNSKNFVNMGNEAFSSGNYPLALTYFNEALKEAFDVNICINRGLTFLMLNDTCSACRDFKISAAGFDGVPIKFAKDVELVYKNVCKFQSDTIYFNKNGQTCHKDDFRFYEVINKYACETNQSGELHKKGKQTQTIALSGVKYITDKVASFEVIESVKYYYFIDNVLPGLTYRAKIENYEADLKKHINKKFVFNDLPYKEQYINGRIYFNSAGIIIKFELLRCPVIKLNTLDIKAFEDHIMEFLRQIERVEVPEIFYEKVYFYLDCMLAV